MSNLAQWDQFALPYLMKHGAATAEQIMLGATDIDQFDQNTVPQWIADALERGVIEVTGGSGASTRYNITDKGRGWRR